MAARRPFIGITADAGEGRFHVGRSLVEIVLRAGGVPVILPCAVERVGAYLGRCEGILFSGGDDPDLREWGIPLHPRATPIDPGRQAFEWALLEALAARPGMPVLGVCLGMQMMALHAGGTLEQHLADTLPTAGDHWGRTTHPVRGSLGGGSVHSHHRQGITHPGSLAVVATAHDRLIEAVADAGRPFYLGVQWHPERSGEAALGRGLIERFVAAARARGPRTLEV